MKRITKGEKDKQKETYNKSYKKMHILFYCMYYINENQIKEKPENKMRICRLNVVSWRKKERKRIESKKKRNENREKRNMIKKKMIIDDNDDWKHVNQ